MEWNRIFCDMVDVLDYIYCCGYVYNDFKLNNVVLEKWEDEWFYFVVIDFGKSVLFIKVKNVLVKLLYLKESYKDIYVVFELVDGSGKLLVKSDIYLLVFLIKIVCRFLKFCSVVVVKNVLVVLLEERFIIRELKEVLSVEI